MNGNICLKIFVALCLLGGSRVNGFFCIDTGCKLLGQRCCDDGNCCSQFDYNIQGIGIGGIVGIVIGVIIFIVICIVACVFCCCRPNRLNLGTVLRSPASTTTTTTQQFGMQQYPTVQQNPPMAYPAAQAYTLPVAYNNPSVIPTYPNQPDHIVQPSQQ